MGRPNNIPEGNESPTDETDQIITELTAELAKWRGRAMQMRGQVIELRAEKERIGRANEKLVEKVIELASRPPTIVEKGSDTAILMAGLRDILNPAAPVYKDGEVLQPGVVDWARDAGLDNSGGVGESDQSIFAGVPDYVLDIERVDPELLKAGAGRGGWFNPTISPGVKNGGQ